VYVLSGSTWNPQQTLSGIGVPNDFFGQGNALDGDTAVVGAYGDSAGAGVLYVFSRTGATWVQQQRVTASDAAANDQLGITVELCNGQIVAGAPGARIGTNAGQGAAYAFSLASGTWTQSQKISASDGITNTQFGYRSACSGATPTGNTLIIGSNNSAQGGLGTAYLFSQPAAQVPAMGRYAPLLASLLGLVGLALARARFRRRSVA
jgi:hypothetical protein